ncbi:MAG: glucose/arabinose dehydrogenase [Granulosicoccus sp.]|jgi:glucose/arabinose dehydrogenase
MQFSSVISIFFIGTFVSTMALATPKPRLLVENLVAPIDLATIPDDSGRRLILDQAGLVHLLNADDTVSKTPFLDITDRLLPVREDFEERGLLGMAIHPEYRINGRFFVTYTAPLSMDASMNWSHTRIVSEFTINSEIPDQINKESERILIKQNWPSRKHNGGALAFGPDGYLYIGFGDGGGIHGVGPETLNDAYNVPKNRLSWDSTAQDLQSLFGKILRIDVDHGYPGYAIPEKNPLVNSLGKDEIYAWGFRNPYRLSFDSNGSSTFYITAVAETLWEAVYQVSEPGNYGWPVREGTHCFDRTRPLDPPDFCEIEVDSVTDKPIYDPVVEYPNMSVQREGSTVDLAGVGTAVVGAVMLRGTGFGDLVDHLLIADWSSDFRNPSGQLFVAKENSGKLWAMDKISQLDTRIVALVRDTDERVYVMTNENYGPYGNTGKIYLLEM